MSMFKQISGNHSPGNCIVSTCFYSPMHVHILWNTHRKKKTQFLYMKAHKHTCTLTLCVSTQPCRQQEGETLLPVEEWVEGAVVTECTQLHVCMCTVYCEYMCEFILYFYCCLRGYWFISTCSVDTTCFGRSLKLLTPVICDAVSGRI